MDPLKSFRGVLLQISRFVCSSLGAIGSAQRFVTSVGSLTRSISQSRLMSSTQRDSTPRPRRVSSRTPGQSGFASREDQSALRDACPQSSFWNLACGTTCHGTLLDPSNSNPFNSLSSQGVQVFGLPASTGCQRGRLCLNRSKLHTVCTVPPYHTSFGLCSPDQCNQFLGEEAVL